MKAILLTIAAMALSCGCRDLGYQVAPVEGKVTLDGQPLADAHVSFRPVLDQNKVETGPGSVAYTNQQGEFKLRLVDPEQFGAVVGRHRVAITLPEEEQLNSISDSDQDDAGRPKLKVYKMPNRYRDGSALGFEVPPEGSRRANFALTTP